MPSEYITIFTIFAPVFTKRIWLQVQVLLIGAILTPGQRTVAAVLLIMGLSSDKHFQNYHRVLNRAVWSSLELSRLLLGMLIKTFAVRGPVVMWAWMTPLNGGVGQRSKPRASIAIRCVRVIVTMSKRVG